MSQRNILTGVQFASNFLLFISKSSDTVKELRYPLPEKTHGRDQRAPARLAQRAPDPTHRPKP